jgi:hypothetical protein
VLNVARIWLENDRFLGLLGRIIGQLVAAEPVGEVGPVGKIFEQLVLYCAGYT